VDNISFTIWISLCDSLMTTYQIVVFVLLLTTAQPLRNAFGYLAGISAVYFLWGLGIYLALGRLGDLISKFFASAEHNPAFYQWEFLLGVASVALGLGYYYWNKRRGLLIKENWVLSKLRYMNGWFAFGLGAFVSFTAVSVPYVFALTKYTALHLEFSSAVGLIIFYNIVYILPMICILGLYLIARRGIDEDHDALHEKARLLNLHLTTWAMVGFGLFCLIDTGCYFVFGHALIQAKFF
jgi:hypothetical protein